MQKRSTRWLLSVVAFGLLTAAGVAFACVGTNCAGWEAHQLSSADDDWLRTHLSSYYTIRQEWRNPDGTSDTYITGSHSGSAGEDGDQ